MVENKNNNNNNNNYEITDQLPITRGYQKLDKKPYSVWKNEYKLLI